MKIDHLRVEVLLAERGITKKDFAKNCGLSPQLVSLTLRRGTCEPRTAGKIAAGLGVPVRDILPTAEVSKA